MAGGGHSRSRTVGTSSRKLLALALRIQQARTYTFDDARREFGLSMRTYRRYLASLRSAGMMLANADGGGVRYIGFDLMFCEDAIV